MLAAQPGLSIRLSNFIFARKPGIEVDAWKTLTAEEKPDLNRAVAG
jgi:hypothetical protein